MCYLPFLPGCNISTTLGGDSMIVAEAHATHTARIRDIRTHCVSLGAIGGWQSLDLIGSIRIYKSEYRGSLNCQSGVKDIQY